MATFVMVIRTTHDRPTNHMSYRPNSKARTLLLGDHVEHSSVGDLIKSILEINADDDLKASEFIDWEREPIKLFINTYGGSVYDGLALINTITLSKTPVHTLAVGSAMSMGLYILVAGHQRFMAPYATLMYHQISTFVWDKLQGIKDQLKEAERLEALCEQLLFDRTKLKAEDVDGYKRRKAEWYIDAKEAIKRGIVDEIMQPGTATGAALSPRRK